MCVRSVASKVLGGFHGVLMKICENLCKFAQTVQNLFPNPFQPAGDPLALWACWRCCSSIYQGIAGKNKWEYVGRSGNKWNAQRHGKKHNGLPGCLVAGPNSLVFKGVRSVTPRY